MIRMIEIKVGYFFEKQTRTSISGIFAPASYWLLAGILVACIFAYIVSYFVQKNIRVQGNVIQR